MTKKENLDPLLRHSPFVVRRSLTNLVCPVARTLADRSWLCRSNSTPAATLYYVTGTLERLYCFASDDNGATWYEYAIGADAYPINSAGWHGLYAIGGARELTADGQIIGLFTEVADFAHSYYEPHSGKVHFFRIQT